MTDAERLEALQNLFLAGAAIPDGARKVVGFLLSRESGTCKHAEICEAFSTSRTSAWRWIAEARDGGFIAGEGPVLRVEDVNVEKLRELASVTPRV